LPALVAVDRNGVTGLFGELTPTVSYTDWGTDSIVLSSDDGAALNVSVVGELGGE
jgi:hypothetical protein